MSGGTIAATLAAGAEKLDSLRQILHSVLLKLSGMLSTQPTGLSVVSVLNSTATPLDADTTFTGTWEDILDYPAITINGGADVAGTLYADFSDDASADLPTYRAVQLSTGDTTAWNIHGLIRVGRYFRVRLVNGSSNQSSMSISTILSRTPLIAFPTSRTAQTVSTYSDALLVRDVTTFDFDVGRGKLTGLSVGHKFGRNASVATSPGSDIWSVGGSYTGWLQAAAPLRVKAGGNAADTSGGAGAQTIVVAGLDSNWLEAEETITLAGAAQSAQTSTSFIRMFRAYVKSCGTYHGNNTGVITIETTGGAVMGAIQAGEGQTTMTMYTVPAGKQLLLRSVFARVDSTTGKSADVYFWKLENADDVSTPFTGAKRLVHQFPGLLGSSDIIHQTWDPVPAKTDLWASGIGAASTGVTIEYEFILEDV